MGKTFDGSTEATVVLQRDERRPPVPSVALIRTICRPCRTVGGAKGTPVVMSGALLFAVPREALDGRETVCGVVRW